MLHRMGFTKRRANSKVKVPAEQVLFLKAQFLFDIKSVVVMEDVPKELIINWDQTGIHYVPVSNWTMEKKGMKRVEVFGADDKRQITAVFGGTMSGDFLPPQLIYQGKSAKCLPRVNFPESWHVTYSENHWSNEGTMEEYIAMVIKPYVEEKRRALQLDPTHSALVIFDKFRGQCTEKIFHQLHASNIRMVIVPSNCTDLLQPLDLSVNKPAKDFLRRQFQSWYSDQVLENLKHERSEVVDVRMSVVKLLSANWMIKLYDYMKSNPTIVSNGFAAAGITFDD